MDTLRFVDTKSRPFSDEQIALLETFADQAVIAIENIRLFKELDQRTHELTRSVGELKALGEVSQAVSSTLDLEAVLTRIVSHAVQVSGTDGGANYEYDEEPRKSSCCGPPITWKKNSSMRFAPIRRGWETGWWAGRRSAVNRYRFPISSKSARTRRACAQMLERFGFRASLAVPLLREDRIIGGLVVRRKSTGEFRPEVIELLKTSPPSPY